MSAPKLVYVTLIRTTPAKLWQALTDPEFIRQYWFGHHHTSTWKEGDAIENRSPQGKLDWQGKILKSIPESEVVFNLDHFTGEPPSKVSFKIERLGEGTFPQGDAVQLTVIHEDFPEVSKIRDGVSLGWPAILSSLKSLLETGTSLELSWRADAA